MLSLHNTPETMNFEAFYQKYFSRVQSYLSSKMANREDAEDLTQEVFTYCYQNFDSYDPQKASYGTWLYMIVNSRYKNYLRDRKQEEDIDDYSNIIPDDTADQEKAMQLQELRNTIADALLQLPERNRQVVVMRFFQDKSFAEIAEALDINESNARVLLFRTMKTLQRDLQDLELY